jgi:hypothetical protein
MNHYTSIRLRPAVKGYKGKEMGTILCLKYKQKAYPEEDRDGEEKVK